MARVGQAGAAMFPFMTGAMTQKYGAKVLQPILVGMMSSLLILWALLPSSTKRRGD
ncbi:major facilitator superfamily transporter [Ceratobasidium sp. AG-Ba]|nr:major facilitator superfamily transporter [Ceratobasidium sp. AG-Ba]QRV99611.1 major facilitator superfamily transporter [Ceratobasidium sp. AG-Ba]QRW14142.1 major facilitator superfamily transporter [Ceratobasidium sp. AG-Ba]